MLYWPKLLIASYATTKAIEAYIPLYLISQLQLTLFQASVFIAFIYLSRVISGLWTGLLDKHPLQLHTLILLSSLISSVSAISLLLNINSTLWSLVMITLLNGLFYQPLDILIHAIIIKTLGDYRVLFYNSYLCWHKMVMVMITGLIGLIACFIHDDYLNYLLLAIFMAGMVSFVFISLVWASIEPADPVELDINQEQAPLLLKNALHLTTDPSNQFQLYKPYSIFGEQLSHISEEDASQLDRMFTNTDESLRHVTSYNSIDAPSFYSRNSDTLFYRQPVDDTVLNEPTIISSYALALLPLPSPTDPLVAAIRLCQSVDDLDQALMQDGYYQQNSNNYALVKMYYWKTQTLCLTLFLLGMGYTLINAFLLVYVYSVLEISISMISCLIIVHLISEAVVTWVVEKWFFHRLRLMMVTTCIHLILILCAILYPCLRPNQTMTPIALLILQACQSSAFQLGWLSGADQIHLLYWNPLDRIKQRTKIAFMYSSLGPALGALLAGALCSVEQTEDDTLIYKICVALFTFSFVVSWGWTSTEAQ
ncbi:hypothetical protein A0J61_08378 [Choanephora cucurbitarum]|uniref:Major facilitator superfamily associated domain-containing protein n=1 Tax=Choanephora cucurbitarum TaxID=101091 RepID=A0A1C7N8A2_9FUNG|nr:hypothetical protein A0J61_08378 [Choanephora cucurbitarum]